MGLRDKICNTVAALGLVGFLSGMGGTIYHAFINEPKSTPEIEQVIRLDHKLNNFEVAMENGDRHFKDSTARELYCSAVQIEYDLTRQEYNQLMVRPKIEKSVASYQESIKEIDQKRSINGVMMVGSLLPFGAGMLSSSNREREEEKNKE